MGPFRYPTFGGAHEERPLLPVGEGLRINDARRASLLEALVLLIASYAEIGRNAEARVHAQELLRNNPKFSVNEFLSQESRWGLAETTQSRANKGTEGDRLSAAVSSTGLAPAGGEPEGPVSAPW